MTTITCKISEKLNAELETLARRRRISKSAILREYSAVGAKQRYTPQFTAMARRRRYVFSAKGAISFQPGTSPQDSDRIVNER
jgi:hypothetical protein